MRSARFARPLPTSYFRRHMMPKKEAEEPSHYVGTRRVTNTIFRSHAT